MTRLIAAAAIFCVACGGDDPEVVDAPVDDVAEVEDDGPTPDPGPTPDVDDSDPGSVDPGEVECTPKYGKACQDNTSIWVDSCGNPGVVHEICGDDKTCEGGECQEVCDSHASQKCQGGNLFWFDSCGNPEDVAQACEQWCADDTCVTGTLDGTWLVTAEPGSQQLGAVGAVEYGPRTATITIVGAEVTMTVDVGVPQAIYKGSIVDQKLDLAAQWADPGPPPLEHEATFQAELTGPAQFHGVEVDTVTSQGSPQGKLVWNVTGKKQ